MLPMLEGIAVGMMLGYMGCIFHQSYARTKRRWSWRVRIVPFDLRGQRRDLPDQARALAFATLYEFCRNNYDPHFVTEEDKGRLYSIVHAFVSENRDKLVEWRFGVDFAWEEEITDMAIEQAVSLFLQV